MFLCCGDALFDLFVQPAASAGSLELKGHVGGSTLNVALGLSRLGQSSAYLCKNSDDALGDRIVHFLQSNGVNVDYVLRASQNSTLAIVETSEQGVPAYTFYTENTADVSIRQTELPAGLPDAIQVIHVGSYSTCADPTGAALLDLVQREQQQRLISYDPNVRASIQPDLDIWRERFRAFAATAGFIKASDEDIATLYGENTSFDSFASDTLALGPSLVVVTAGSRGATIYAANGEQAHAPGVNVNVVDTVGAGDTFQAASLHWLNQHGLIVDGGIDPTALSGGDGGLTELVGFAASAAALTCTRAGADLPTLQDLERFRADATR